MIGDTIQEALTQIRQLKTMVLERQRFHGYSGVARIASGFMALLAAVIMTMPFFPHSVKAHLLGWGALFVVASLINLVALLYWFLRDPRVDRNPRRLVPLLDSLLPLLVGGALTFALIVHHQTDLLFGVWMCMFGLSNIASHYVMPRLVAMVGVFYVVCGTAWAISPGVSFLNPWPMGLVFFAGEWAGGMILHLDQRRTAALIKQFDVPRESTLEEPPVLPHD